MDILISKRKKILIGSLIFFICLGWVLLLTQGLPIGDPDDWDHILAARDLPWKTLVTNLSVPWCTSKLWIGQIDRMNEVTHRRLFLSIILKSVYSFFGFRFWPYYIFSKAIFFAGTLTLLFFLALRLTNSFFFSLLSVLFFATVPAHYAHVLWLSVPDTMIHFWMSVGIILYLQIFSNIKTGGSQKYFTGLALSLLLIGWIAIKTKETALLLPLTLGTSTILYSKDLWAHKRKLFPLLAILGFLVFLFIPIAGIQNKVGPPSHFQFETISRMLFRNYRGGYEDEARIALFSLKHVWPVSIFRTLGFFSLWSLIGTALLYLAAKLKSRSSISRPNKPLIVVLTIWLFYEICFMGLFQPDARYFSGTMIPIVLLAAYFVRCTGYLWSSAVRKCFFLLVAASVIYHSFRNFQHVIYLRTLIGQKANRFLNVAQSIYRDQFPEQPLSLEEVVPFYTAQYVPEPKNRPRIEHVTYFIEMDYGTWNKTESGSLEEFEAYAKKGSPYYGTTSKDKFKDDPHARLIKTISGFNRDSWVETLIYRLKRKNPREFYIYKYV